MRCLPALALTSLALTAVGVTPALAAPAGGAVGSAAASYTVFLTAPDPAGLDQLAAAHGISRAARLRAVARLVPSAASHDRVAAVLGADGFRVTARTAWSLTVSGPAGRAAQLFGSRPAVPLGGGPAARAAAAGALPRVPGALAGQVAAVYPTVGGPPVYHHQTGLLSGADYRSAYTPAGSPASTGRNDAGLTVATVQLADFYSSPRRATASASAADLSAYATAHHLADPVAAGRYHAVMVDGGPSADDDSLGGDAEVSLDQESILSTAPSAGQQAYFAPNTNAGYDDAFAAVYDDVTGDAHATAPNPGIVALSVSWGECESYASDVTVLEPILKSLVATGVTVFAASGDSGIYDCGTDRSAVDYPASSPWVVGVGGTRLHAATSAANTGANWAETAWTCTGAAGCRDPLGGGTGGGASSRFGTPAYQRVGIDDAPFRGRSRRLVPDISAAGDPATGFVAYCSDPGVTGPYSHQFRVGGTSLAAPVSAAGLTNALGDAGLTRGVGDIHNALYSAYAATRSQPAGRPTRVFRDVTVGSNGADADRGSGASADPSVHAQVGYDTVSGLGAPLWSALLPYIADRHVPAAPRAGLALSAMRTPAWRQMTASWTLFRGADRLLPSRAQVTITRRGASGPAYTTTTAARSVSLLGVPGSVYRVDVVALDLAGRASAPAHAWVTVPIDDGRFRHSPAWRVVHDRADLGGANLRVTRPGASLAVTTVGTTFTLVLRTGPDHGRLAVYLAGRRIATVSEYSATPGRALVRVFSSTVRAPRTFSIHALTWRPVDVDGGWVGY